MSETAEIFATLDDYLLSLADGLAAAQAALTRMPGTSANGEAMAYVVPSLEFELKMSMKVERDDLLTNRYGARRGLSSDNLHLKMAPIQAGSATATTTEIVSTIRGTLVAVPPNGGKPTLRVAVDVGAEAKGERPITVTVCDALGALASGVDVEINVDGDESQNLSATDPSVKGATYVRAVSLTTDDLGIATTNLVIGSPRSIDQSATAFLVIDAAGRTESVVVPVYTVVHMSAAVS